MITKAFTDSQETKESYSKLFKTASDVLTRIKLATSVAEPIQDKDQVYYKISTALKAEVDKITDEDILINGAIDIDSLGEYFSILKILKQIHPRFLRLPVDEDLFKINANTRVIEFPENDYVYAVLGDKNAETVYFSIDRYYDIFDLGSDDIQVVIQAEKTVNNKTDSYLFSTTKKDVDSEPGTVIFGWVLPEEITNTSGQVRFSVRFYNINEEGKLTFGLGTLPSILIVENSILNDLDLSISDNITTTDTFIKNYERSGTEPIADPTINTFEGLNTDQILQSNAYAILTCVASTPQASEIDYAWYKKKANGEFSRATESSYCIELDNYSPLSSLTKENFNEKVNRSISPEYDDTYYILETDASIQVYREVISDDIINYDEGQEDEDAGIILYEQIPGKILKTKQGGIYICRVKVTASRYSKIVDTDEINVLSACPVNFNKSLKPAYFTEGNATVADGVTTVKYSLTSDDFAINTDNVKWASQKDDDDNYLTYGDENTTQMIFKDSNNNNDIDLTNIIFNDEQSLGVIASLENTVNFTSKSTDTNTAKRNTKFYKPLCSFSIGLDETNRTITINYNQDELDRGYITRDDAIREETGLDPTATRNITIIHLADLTGATGTITANSIDEVTTAIANLHFYNAQLSAFINYVSVEDTILGTTKQGTYGTAPASS